MARTSSSAAVTCNPTVHPAFSNMTYVTLVSAAVPEIDPTTAHGAVVLLVSALGLLERRLRQAAIARHAA